MSFRFWNETVLIGPTLGIAFLLDYWLGEISKLHPLVGFGRVAQVVEKRFNRFNSMVALECLGGLSWCLLVLPLPLFYWWVYSDSLFFYCLDTLVVYFAIGHQSLREHALNIYQPLKEGRPDEARRAVSLIVSRQTDKLDEHQISRATIESVLENGHDAIIASLFWYVIGGAPLVIAHRLANTLDAMWGYRNKRFNHFGLVAAKADDYLGWPSAKITGLLYIMSRKTGVSNFQRIILNAYRQSQVYKSLNGGWVMAAGAGVLNIRLGGRAEYHGKEIQSVVLGEGRATNINDITAALQLVTKASLLWVALILFYELILVGVGKWY